MPTDPVSSARTDPLPTVRDEALRRYAQHLAAVRLKNSRWRAMLSRNQLAARLGRLAGAAAAKSTLHAH